MSTGTPTKGAAPSIDYRAYLSEPTSVRSMGAAAYDPLPGEDEGPRWASWWRFTTAADESAAVRLDTLLSNSGVTAAQSRYNYALNPSFENGQHDWTPLTNGASLTVIDKTGGGKALQVGVRRSYSNANPTRQQGYRLFTGLPVGETLRISFTVFAPSGFQGGTPPQVGIVTSDTSRTWTFNQWPGYYDIVVPANGIVSILLYEGVQPDTLIGFFPIAIDSIYVGLPNGSYFDGDTPDTASTTYSWVGTPYQSYSIAQPVVAPYDTDLRIYEDRAGTLVLVGHNDSVSVTEGRSQTDILAKASTTYYVLVGLRDANPPAGATYVLRSQMLSDFTRFTEPLYTEDFSIYPPDLWNYNPAGNLDDFTTDQHTGVSIPSSATTTALRMSQIAGTEQFPGEWNSRPLFQVDDRPARLSFWARYSNPADRPALTPPGFVEVVVYDYLTGNAVSSEAFYGEDIKTDPDYAPYYAGTGWTKHEVLVEPGTYSLTISWHGAATAKPEDFNGRADFEITDIEVVAEAGADPAPDLALGNSAFTLRGPDNSPHHGAFLIPTNGPGAHHISMQAKVQSKEPGRWLRLSAKYLRRDDLLGSWEEGDIVPLLPAVSIAPAPEWTALVMSSDASTWPTHWQPVFEFFSENPLQPKTYTVPLGADEQILVDNIFVTENGLPEETYLDGDQPGAVWEGTPYNSTSRYADEAAE